jgi:hypothetical protein
MQELASIECIPHWHYRLSGSRDKEELTATLKELGFEDWNPRETE